MSKQKNKINDPLLEAESNLRSNLQALDACEYLVDYINNSINRNFNDHDEKFSGAISVIKTKIRQHKLYVWESIGMLTPVSESLQKLVEKKLAKAIADSGSSVSWFLADNWSYKASDLDEFRVHIKTLLETANKITPSKSDFIEIPKRQLTPDL